MEDLNFACFSCGARTGGLPATGLSKQELNNPPPEQWRVGDRLRCCPRTACIRMLDDMWHSKQDRFYTPIDEWISQHDNEPILWAVFENEERFLHTISLIPIIPGQHIESGKVLRSFYASSTIEAFTKHHQLMGWRPYQTHHLWDAQRRLWKIRNP